MISLGLPPGPYTDGFVKDLNQRGQVVGSSSGEQGGFRAALFLRGQVYDLNTLLTSPTDLVLEQATDIND